ncbi:MAG: SoxR reducing system RseC family protein [Christensenellales bacterium]|jgi:sigma-E factor negative regulatory protein RseC
MKELGTVTQNKKGESVVRFERKTACEKCNMCLKSKDEMFVELAVANTLDASVGDRVEVEIPDNTVLKASFIVYILPASALLIALALTQNMEDWASFSIAIAALAATYIGVIGLDRYLKKKKGFIPKMTAIYKKEDDTLEGESDRID